MAQQQLSGLLRQCAELLRSVGETFWSRKIESALEHQDTPSALAREVLDWFGGMGSLNDRIISPMNGDRIAPGEEDEVNSRLSSLRGKIYVEAQRIRYESRTSS